MGLGLAQEVKKVKIIGGGEENSIWDANLVKGNTHTTHFFA